MKVPSQLESQIQVEQKLRLFYVSHYISIQFNWIDNYIKVRKKAFNKKISEHIILTL